jgi:hypothetical protein
MGGVLVGKVIKAGEPYHEKVGYPEKIADAIFQTMRVVGGVGEEAYKQWKASGSFPASLDELAKTAGAKAGVNPKDGWGRPVTYRRTSLGITVSSPGPDGRDGTEDDIQLTIGNDGKASME